MSKREAAAFQDFLVEAKSYWMTEIFPAFRRSYEAATAGKPLKEPEQVSELVGDWPLYSFYAWLERHIQREKYSGRYGLIWSAEERRADLERSLERVAGDPALLTLNPDVVIPQWYSVIDTHQHPGNLTGNILAGYIYKASAGSTQPGQTEGYQLHERFAKQVAGYGEFRRILDSGCGFGKSTITLAKQFPAATLDGIDLSVPCLKLAALEALDSQIRNIHYRQTDVCDTPYDDATFDLVTSTMLLHELPTDVVSEYLKESYRILTPGGMIIHLDFRVRDPFLRFIHYGHALRNNEPYMEAFDRLDISEALRATGFEDPAIASFAERGETGTLYPETWRLPWTTITARKPS